MKALGYLNKELTQIYDKTTNKDDIDTIRRNNQEVIRNMSSHIDSFLTEDSILQKNSEFQTVMEFVANNFLCNEIRQNIKNYFSDSQ